MGSIPTGGTIYIMMTKENCEAFLNDLTEITKKHGVKFWSCGCCAGLNLVPLKEECKIGYRYEGDLVRFYEGSPIVQYVDWMPETDCVLHEDEE